MPLSDRGLRFWFKLAGIGALVATAVYLVRQSGLDDWQSLIAAGRELPGAVFLLTFCMLPLVGIPISIFLVVAGLKYGTMWGMVVATGVTAVHNLISYAVTKSWLQARIESCLERLGYAIPSIPQRHQVWFTAVFAGVPGLPYAIKLYSLALTNIPFSTYFWAGWPMYAASCIVYVGLGHAASSLSAGWFVLVVAISVTLLILGRRLAQKSSGSASRG